MYFSLKISLFLFRVLCWINVKVKENYSPQSITIKTSIRDAVFLFQNRKNAKEKQHKSHYLQELNNIGLHVYSPVCSSY